MEYVYRFIIHYICNIGRILIFQDRCGTAKLLSWVMFSVNSGVW